jgi:MFS family permease
MIALLLIPPTPVLAFWALAPIFMLDQVLNAGILIANNGFMIKHSPSQNRTMYIAASTALAGIVGGVTSIAAGGLMTLLAGQRWELLGRSWGHFHVMFAGSIVLRWVAAGWVRKIREPNALPVKHVMGEILGGLPWRPLLFPIGLYRSVSETELTGKPATAQPPRPKLLDRGQDRKSSELTGHRQG